MGPEAEPSVVQLWPEHFDAGCDLGAGPGGRVNLGASPGDSFSARPYHYVGPWEPERPGDEAYWNAPFGAVLAYDQLLAASDPAASAVGFLRRDVELLGFGAARAVTVVHVENCAFGAAVPPGRVLGKMQPSIERNAGWRLPHRSAAAAPIGDHAVFWRRACFSRSACDVAIPAPPAFRGPNR